jgi:hypothetical protein
MFQAPQSPSPQQNLDFGSESVYSLATFTQAISKAIASTPFKIDEKRHGSQIDVHRITFPLETENKGTAAEKLSMLHFRAK